MVNSIEKAQHLWRCSPHYIHKPRVACTIVWQPWVIKSTTPMVLKNIIHHTICVILCNKPRHFIVRFALFRDTICVISSHKTGLIETPFASIHFALYYQLFCHLKLTLQRPPQFQRLTTPLSLRRGAGGEALSTSFTNPKDHT